MSGPYDDIIHLPHHVSATRPRGTIVVSQEKLYEHVWQEPYTNSRSVINIIYNLRSKIEPDPQNPIYIITKYGSGYKFQSK
jgi:DNA-binding response OmpR family regulator